MWRRSYPFKIMFEKSENLSIRRSELCIDNEVELYFIVSSQWTRQTNHELVISVRSPCIFCLNFAFEGAQVKLVWFLAVGNGGQGRFVFCQLHAPVDGWAFEFGPPCETSPVVAQNALVRNKRFSILFWASVSGAFRHVLKCVEYICHTGAECWHISIKLQCFFWFYW